MLHSIGWVGTRIRDQEFGGAVARGRELYPVHFSKANLDRGECRLVLSELNAGR